jgi:hypothetical protein
LWTLSGLSGTPTKICPVSFQEMQNWMLLRSAIRLLTGIRVCFLRPIVGKFHQEIRAGNTILLGRPSAEVGELAAL